MPWEAVRLCNSTSARWRCSSPVRRNERDFAELAVISMFGGVEADGAGSEERVGKELFKRADARERRARALL